MYRKVRYKNVYDLTTTIKAYCTVCGVNNSIQYIVYTWGWVTLTQALLPQHDFHYEEHNNQISYSCYITIFPVPVPASKHFVNSIKIHYPQNLFRFYLKYLLLIFLLILHVYLLPLKRNWKRNKIRLWCHARCFHSNIILKMYIIWNYVI